ncbi:MAG: RidA family protein [Pseudomonadota bacterium]
MSLKIVNTEKAPKAVGPYSQAIRAGEFLFCSGQIPIDPATGRLELFDGNVAEQTKIVMTNLKAVLAAEGLSFKDVVKTTIYLSDMENFAQVNEMYASFLGDHRPARATVEVARLPKDVGVEIDAIAWAG